MQLTHLSTWSCKAPPPLLIHCCQPEVLLSHLTHHWWDPNHFEPLTLWKWNEYESYFLLTAKKQKRFEKSGDALFLSSGASFSRGWWSIDGCPPAGAVPSANKCHITGDSDQPQLLTLKVLPLLGQLACLHEKKQEAWQWRYTHLHVTHLRRPARLTPRSNAIFHSIHF